MLYIGLFLGIIGIVNTQPVKIESLNFPGRCIQVRSDSSVYHSPCNRGGGMTVQLVRGLSTSHGVSFKTGSNTYLRHENSLLRSNVIPTQPGAALDLFKVDATFIVKLGFIHANLGYISFESVNFPGYFIRHQNTRLKISTIGDVNLNKLDATWKYIPDGLCKLQNFDRFFEGPLLNHFYFMEQQYEVQPSLFESTMGKVNNCLVSGVNQPIFSYWYAGTTNTVTTLDELSGYTSVAVAGYASKTTCTEYNVPVYGIFIGAWNDNFLTTNLHEYNLVSGWTGSQAQGILFYINSAQYSANINEHTRILQLLGIKLNDDKEADKIYKLVAVLISIAAVLLVGSFGFVVFAVKYKNIKKQINNNRSNYKTVAAFSSESESETDYAI